MGDKLDMRQELRDEIALLQRRIQELELLEARQSQAEKALRATEDRYRTLFDRAGDGILIISVDGKLIEINESFARMHGYDRDEMPHLIQNLRELDAPETFQQAPERIARILAGEVMTFEVEHYHRDGHVFPLEVSASMIDVEGDRYILCFHRDITKRKLADLMLHASETKHRRLFETMAQGVVYQAADGRIISANPAAERILGLSLDQLLGKTSLDPGWKAVREDGSDLPGPEHPAMLSLRTGQPVERFVMGVVNQQMNKHSWILVSAIPLFQPGETTPFQVYATLEDITDRKRLDDELLINTKNLEGVNTALSLLLKQVESSRADLEGKILSNIRELVLPNFARLRHTSLSDTQKNILQTAETNLNNVTSTFLHGLKMKFFKLSPREIEVATFIIDGKSIKEIAEILCLSKKTIELHRGSLRKKLGLRNQKINLRSYLMTVQ